jgi:general secretion pathway protein K
MRPRRRRERGIALLLVLWIFMILGVLALDFSRYMRDDAMAAINLAEETRGYYLALAGMNRAIYDAERTRDQGNGTGTDPTGQKTPRGLDTDEDDAVLVPPDGEWHEGDFAGGRWSVRMIDEGGRIPINKVDFDVLKPVITNLIQAHIALGRRLGGGMDRRTAGRVDIVVDSILDWRDRGNEVRPHGAESEYYLKRRVPYRAKNAFFDSPEELLLVRGITPDLYYGQDGVPGLRDVFSVYNTSGGKLSIATTTAAVFQALLGIDQAAAEDLVAQRTDGVPILDQVKAQLIAAGQPTLANLLVGEPTPQIVRIQARADMAVEHNRSRVEAVADLGSDLNEGTRILRWLDRAPWEGIPPGAPSTSPGDDA